MCIGDCIVPQAPVRDCEQRRRLIELNKAISPPVRKRDHSRVSVDHGMLPAGTLGRTTSGTIARLFIGASMGAAAAYLAQYKGWNYHLLPLSALLILTATWLFAAAERGSGRQPGMARIALAAGVIILGLQIVRGPYQASTTSAFAPFVKQRGESILVLSADVAAIYP